MIKEKVNMTTLHDSHHLCVTSFIVFLMSSALNTLSFSTKKVLSFNTYNTLIISMQLRFRWCINSSNFTGYAE